jgi:metallo-beta-lactamase family protein
MKVKLFGAAGCVTGSAYYVSSKEAAVLIDFGIFQGEKSQEKNNRKMPAINIGTLNAVLITHGHLDHCGRLPILTKNGYRGPIFATEATIDIICVILKDSLHVQENELLRINRRRARKGEPPLEPDYTAEDVENTFKLLIPIQYNTYVDIAPTIKARVKEAGHLLGSACIELTVHEDNRDKKIIFSGDLGRKNMAIIKDPDPFHSADLVFMESTYGDRDHKPMNSTLLEAKNIILKAIESKGKILVPSFAVGRAQQLLYYLARAIHRGNLPEIPIYLDSPMAIEATKIYLKHQELFDEEAEELFSTGVIKGDFSRMNISQSANDSKALNDLKGPCIILAGAGMCHAGRILHHLRHNLQFPETTVMIIGYQGTGTLGRKLIDGEKRVKIYGEDVIVNAQVESLGGLSAHAGQSDLLQWFDTIAPSKPKLVLSHGEEKGRKPLAEIIKTKYGITPILPEFGETINI